MDTSSMLFATFLNVIGSGVQGVANDIQDLAVSAEAVEYEQTAIVFQHQSWTIKAESVCADIAMNLAEYSSCTIKAKRMFLELCTELTGMKKQNWRIIKSRRMYCNAAAAYEPVIAAVAVSAPPDAITDARESCNLATLNAMGSQNAQTRGARDVACEHYRGLKAAQESD